MTEGNALSCDRRSGGPSLALGVAGAAPAAAQKYGGTLTIQHWDSPASMSIHEEATYSVVVPMMGVMNNLVLFRQDKEQNSMDNIVPDLAESWSWSEDGKELTFKLRQGVKWHDGKPFTAADVKCTMDLIQDKAKDRLRGNPRKEWYNNVQEVTTNGDYEAVFKLKRPQPALLTLLASGYSPIYPCHVTPAADAAAPDRHGAVQVRRVQAERTHQGRQEPGLLEEGPALSRRRSNTRSCRTARRRSSALSPGSST